MFLDKFSGDGPIEGLSGTAIVLPGRSVDEEGKVMRREFVIWQLVCRNGPNDWDSLIDKKVHFFRGFIAMELNDIDEALIDEFNGEGE